MIESRSAHKRSVKESLLLLLCGSLAIAVTVLAYLRLRDEHWTLAFVDVGVMSIMLLVFLFVYFSRRTRTVGILMALGFIGAALMSTLLLGTREVYWAFPALMLAYFMLDARQATILTGCFAGCFLAIVWDELPAVDLTKICLALVTTVLLANAFSLTNRRQLADLRRMVNIDPLTGAGNRRAQNLKLDSACAIFRRNERAASVLLLDIDFFKQINDTHGHIVGDQILVELSELIKRTTRATESLYRYGGEEFVVVAEQVSLDAAVNLAEKLRSHTERELFAAGIRITVSIGVAELQRGEEKEDWLRRADAALYRAKGRGRNRVIVAESTGMKTLVHAPERPTHRLTSNRPLSTRRAAVSRSM
jgi:diguanylate cyclase (GGDEF)-like protein